MRLLADENIDPYIVEWLRSQGHDVLAIRETSPSISDLEVIRIANSTDRVLITQDNDFGALAFEQSQKIVGVVLLRFKYKRAVEVIEHLTLHMPDALAAQPGAFIVISSDKLRLRKMP